MRSHLLRYIAVPLFAIVFANNAHGQEVLDTLAHRPDISYVKINDLFFEASRAKQHGDILKAIELFEELAKTDPKNPVSFYELSQLYADDRKIDKAEANIKKAVTLANDNKWYSVAYADILAKQGKYQDAAEVAAALADREKGDASYAGQAADYYERAKDYKSALKYIDKALVLGADEDLQLQKMRIYLGMKQQDKAAEVGMQLIASDPKNIKYYKWLGDLYDNNNMPEKELKVYQDANKLMPDEPLIEIGLADGYIKMKDTVNFRKYVKKSITSPKLETATQLQFLYVYIQSLSESEQNAEGISILSTLLKQHPDDPRLLSTYGDFLAADMRIDSAVVFYKKAVAIKASDFDVWNRLLNAYAFQNNADSLIKYSEKVTRLFPNQAIVHYYNSLGHYNKKEYPAAVKAMRRAIDMLPETDTKKLAEFYSMLGEIYNSSKQYAESDKAFDEALKSDPQNASTLNNYAYFLSERGERLAKAKEMSGQSLKIRPDEGTFLDTYGWILYKMGDYDKARESVEKAAGSPRADGTIFDHLGDIYFKLNNRARALENWKLAKQKGAANPLLDKKISEEKLYE
jgi:tetratricopeptide (TPR) repeat protein